MDIGKLMAQAKKMQEELQRRLQELRVEGSAGGGMVKVLLDGTRTLVDIKISPEVFEEGDLEMLQDLILAAFQDAYQKVEEESGKIISSLGIPPGLI